MEKSTADDEDIPTLSESTLLALQQFYAEKKIRDSIEKTDYLKGNEASTNLIQEDWNLSQFWYSEETASVLADECIKSAGPDMKIACLCSPTVFRALFNRKSSESAAYLFEFDRRFEKIYGKKFIFYDYNDCPIEKYEHLKGFFDVLLIDPPFLSEECFRKVAEFVKFLSHKDSKLIICSGAIVEDVILELFEAILDFKCPDAIRSLTTSLLEKDFGLNIDIPIGCLVPRLPLRLNYILWVEDLLKLNKISNGNVTGIDIGTGAACIYPLLGYKQCGWKFIATDKDQASVDSALSNLKKNNLTNFIKVLKVDEHTALKGVIDQKLFEDQSFEFCMCNPPFYDKCSLSAEQGTLTEDETILNAENGNIRETATCPKTNARSLNRPDPHSATIAKTGEIFAEGGELAFVSKIIDDSVLLKDRVRIFTSMLGKKASLKPLKKKLHDAKVAEMSSTTFHQGKTQRWALCWTFDANIRLKLDVLRNRIARYTLNLSDFDVVGTNAESGCAFNQTVAWMNDVLTSLEISSKTLPHHRPSSSQRSLKLECTATVNTWSNQRRKKRKEKRCRGIFDDSNNEEYLETKRMKIDDHADRISPDSMQSDRKPLNKELIFNVFLKQEKSDQDRRITLEFCFVSGPSADLLHQVVQYFKNNRCG